MRPRVLLAALLVLGGLSAVPASASPPAGCVLLLGSYPAEVSANLERMRLDRGQPTVLAGHDFYSGTLSGRRVVTGIAGPSPALTRSTTTLALRHWRCVTAVVFTGTAGGAGAARLGDVAVPSAWTGDEGKHYVPVDARALAVARRTAAQATRELGTLAAVNDGPCFCEQVVGALRAVPLGRTPGMVIGGRGATFGGDGLTCDDRGGMLAGCNPCPPGAAAPPLRTLDLTPTAAARAGLVPHTTGLAERAPDPFGDSGTTYVADDMQTTGAQEAARARHVPFLAFRGISDTTDAGDLWPAEYLVYQALAADNAAAAARVWIAAWR